MKLSLQKKMQKFPALGATPPDPRAPAAGGFPPDPQISPPSLRISGYAPVSSYLKLVH